MTHSPVPRSSKGPYSLMTSLAAESGGSAGLHTASHTCVPLLILPSASTITSMNHVVSTQLTLSYPEHCPKAPLLNIMAGFSFFLLGTFQWGSTFQHTGPQGHTEVICKPLHPSLTPKGHVHLIMQNIVFLSARGLQT